MATRYIVNGHDLSGKAGYRLRVGPGEKDTVLDEWVYINGDVDTNGSRRFSVDEDTHYAVIQKRVDGIWQPSSLETGPNSLWVGKNVGIAGVGHHLATESADGHLHFHVHNEFNGETVTEDTKILDAYSFTAEVIFSPDESGSWTGKSFGYAFLTPVSNLIGKGYFRTSETAASAPIRIQIWEGTDTTGALVFDQYYPTGQWTAWTQVENEFYGYMEFVKGNWYYTRVSSTENFSLRTNAAGTTPWQAADVTAIRENSVLQTIDYVDGAWFDKGQYIIDSRQIYVCDSTGIQVGTFASNSDKWDLLGDQYMDSLLDPGAVAFGGADGKITGDVTNLFWDDNNKRLGIGKSPGYDLDVNGTIYGIDMTSVSIITSELAVTNLTEGSIPFIGASGLFSEDNTNLFWDDTNDRLRANQAVIDNNLIADLTDGVYIGRTRVSESHWKSSPVVNDWEELGSSQLWMDVACSSDGQYVTGVVDMGNVWTSDDYGVT